MIAARNTAEQLWTAREVIHVFPDTAATQQFLAWMKQFSLGRKGLLDTLLAASFHQVGIHSALTTNPSDFAVFGVFTSITPNRPGVDALSRGRKGRAHSRPGLLGVTRRSRHHPCSATP
jgi:hypothetical protein